MDPYSRPRGARIRITEDGRTQRHIPLGDLILQTELRVATENNIQAYPCPCMNCHRGLRKPIYVVREHHTVVGRHPFLTKSIIGGDPPEGYPPGGILVDDMLFDDDIVDANPDVQGNGEVRENVQSSDPLGSVERPLDQYHDVHMQVMEALDSGDALHREYAAEPEMDVEDDMDSDTMQGLEKLYRQCTTPLYTGSKCSVVSATIVIMKMCVVFGVSNNFTSELLRYLSEDLLPEGNKLPCSQYAAAKTIRKLGMDYNNIHACPDGCVLYEGEHAELNVCPSCSKSRWMEGTNSVPSKVIRHFPLIPRLKRMWRSPEIAGMLIGYTRRISEDGIMQSVVDSPAWKHIDNDVAFDNFSLESRNMRLALALDGVNPFKLRNTN